MPSETIRLIEPTFGLKEDFDALAEEFTEEGCWIEL